MRYSTRFWMSAALAGMTACGDDRASTGVDPDDIVDIDPDGQGGTDADVSDDAFADPSSDADAPVPDPDGTSDGGETDADPADTDPDAGDATDADDSGGTVVCPQADVTSATVRNVESGAVVGQLRGDDVVRFLGVPFAASPVDGLRWAAPQPPVCTGPEPVEAFLWPPLCPQRDEEGAPVGDEDCLRLNIWTPAEQAAEPRPVVVFIPGGGNVQGGASVSPFPGAYTYDGETWAREQQAVVVVLSYRVGILGWLTGGPTEGLDSVVGGNFGLRDQIAALQWIQRNIAAFGGDPEQVLVFGESAGARNTCMLLASPRARGLFRSAIVQSGGCTLPPESEVRAEAVSFVDAVPECNGSIECLRELSWQDVIARYETTVSIGGPTGANTQPWVDGDILEEQPVRALEGGAAADISVIVGANDDETSRDIPQTLSETQFAALARRTFGPLADQVLALYPLSEFDSPYRAWVAVTSDARFVCSGQLAVEAMAAGGGAVRHYHFEQVTTGPTSVFESWHGLELIYLFGVFDALRYVPSEAERQLGTTMRRMWTSMARSGDPGLPVESDSELGWPLWSDDRPSLVLDGAGIRVDQRIRAEQCEFWTAQLRAFVP